MALPVAPAFDRVRLIPRPNDFLGRNVGASGELFYDKNNQTLRVFNGILAGGFEVVTEDNLPVNSANVEVATVKYLVTVTAEGNQNKYVLNGENAPDITLVQGFTYLFDQSDPTNEFYPNQNGTDANIHPMAFSADIVDGELAGGGSYTEGVIYKLDGQIVSKDKYVNDFVRATSRTVQVTIKQATPSTLYYYCTRHTGMGGTGTKGLPGSGSGSGGAGLSISETAPEDPTAGQLWLRASSGFLYVYYSDADTSQWIQPVAGNVFSGIYSDLVGLPTFATVANTGDYNDILNKPTIPSSLTDLGITDGSANQVLSTDGSGNFTFVDQTGGGGGSSFDQDLNTTDDVEFASVTSPSVITTGTGVTNFTSPTSLTLSATDGVFLSGIARSSEIVGAKTGATGTVDHSLTTASVWNHSSISANFTANIINVPTTDNRAISVALILNQGGTAYIPNAVQINSSAVTIEWEDGSAPTGNANQKDVVIFTITRIGGSFAVLGSLTTYG